MVIRANQISLQSLQHTSQSHYNNNKYIHNLFQYESESIFPQIEINDAIAFSNWKSNDY